MKQRFPSWAPQILLEELEELRKLASLDRAKHLQITTQPSELDNLLNEVYPGRARHELEASRSSDEQILALERLLSHDRMEATWKRLARPSALPEYRNCDIQYHLWTCIGSAFIEFPAVLRKSKPKRAKQQQLEKLASKLQSLVTEIRNDPALMAEDSTVVSNHLAHQALWARHGNQEVIHEIDLIMPTLALAGDVLEGKKTAGWCFSASRDAPLIQRLTFWAETAQRASFIEILEGYANALTLEAQRPDEILKPGDGQQSITTFFARRIIAFMLRVYQRPLDDHVANIVATSLNDLSFTRRHVIKIRQRDQIH